MKKYYTNIGIYRLVATISIFVFHLFLVFAPREVPFETLFSKFTQGLTALSGMLYSTRAIKDIKGFYKKNLTKILIPAGVGILLMALWNFVYMLVTRNFDYVSLWFDSCYSMDLLIQPGNYWYVAIIVIAYLVLPILERATTPGDKKYKIIVVLMCLAEILIDFFFARTMAFVAFVFGYYYGRLTFKNYTERESKFDIARLINQISLTLAGLSVYTVGVTFKFESYFLLRLFDLITEIGGCIFGVAIFYLIIYATRWLNKEGRKPKILTFSDRYSYSFYLFNQAFMCGAMNIVRFTDNMWIKVPIIFALTLIFAVICDNISKIFINKIVKETAK